MCCTVLCWGHNCLVPLRLKQAEAPFFLALPLCVLVLQPHLSRTSEQQWEDIEDSRRYAAEISNTLCRLCLY